MNLTKEQITFISNSLLANGIHSDDLKEDILDHICTAIEEENDQDFETIYKKVISQFGGYNSIKQIQKETNYTIRAKKMLRARRALYVSLFSMIAIFIIGTLFKIMHWPFANNIWVTAGLLLAFLCIPLFFYERHIKSTLKQYS